MNIRSARRFPFLLLLLAFVVGTPHAQQQAPPAQPQPPVTFRSEVNYIEVDAVVTDTQGKPMLGLTVDDFTVLEDGKQQKVTAFGTVNMPIARPDQPLSAQPLSAIGSAQIEPDVQTNEHLEGRLYMIVLDSLHTAPLNVFKVKAAAKAFIEQRLGANDLAAVVHTSGNSEFGQAFTNNRRLLVASIDKFFSDSLQSATLSKLELYESPRNTRIPGKPPSATRSNPVNPTQVSAIDPHERERADRARRMLNTVRRLSTHLSGIRGRKKALILISEGVGYEMASVAGVWDGTTTTVPDDMRDAIGAAQRANMSVFAVDPRGLGTGMEDAIDVAGFTSLDGDRNAAKTRALGMGPEALTKESQVAQDSLRMIAEETGGIAAVNSNDFRGIFDRIVQENSAYYVLGYYAPTVRRDGKFHSIEVKLKRPGLTVRSRRGYVAPRGKAPETTPRTGISPSLRDAMDSPIPMPGIPLRAFAAAFKGKAPNAVVVVSVEMQTSDFRYLERGGLFNDVVTVSFTPIDQNGNTRNGKRSRVPLALKPDAYEGTRTIGLRALSSLDLPPGRYQIRIAVGEDGSQRSGTVLYDLEIPDFANAPISMSGVLLSAASAGRMLTIGSEGVLEPLLPGATTATREFVRGDTIGLYAEVYENAPNATPHTVDLKTTVRGEDGRVVFQTSEARSSTEPQGGRGGYRYTVKIPLTDMAPGSYVIHVEGRSRATNEPGIWRDIQISVK
jgi:VWFA-related protein